MDSTQKDERLFLATLLVLTFVTGMIDAASFLAMGHVFTANMTGNIVFLGFALGGASGLSASRSLIALGAALLGGMLARRLHTWRGMRARSQWLVTAWSVEAVLLLGSAFAAWISLTTANASIGICAVIALTALAMGVRNGTMRRLAVPDMTTTVLTLTVAALAFDFSLEREGNQRWRRRVASIVAMFLGACVGTMLLRYSLVVLQASSAALTLLCILTQIFSRES